MKKIKSILKLILPNKIKIKLSRLKQVITNKNENIGILVNPFSVEDGLVTNFVSNFIEDELFLESYALSKKNGALRNHPGDIYWKAYVACWAADKAKKIEGDFVECGVNLGFLSQTIIRYTNFQDLDKKFYLLDTFSGFPFDTIGEETKKDLSLEALLNYKDCYETVKATFRNFPNVIIVKGKVPNTLPLVEAQKIAYLSIDMNNATAEIAAAEYFWDKMVSNSVILLDDYGHPMAVSHRRKFDEFCKKRNVKVLALPQGQGLILKP